MPYSLKKISLSLLPNSLKKVGTGAHLGISKVPLELGLRVALDKASQGEGGAGPAHHLLPLHPGQVQLRLYEGGLKALRYQVIRENEEYIYPTKI